MKSILALLAAIALTASVSAVATPKMSTEKRDFNAAFTLYGADGQSYSLTVPTDDQAHPIDNSLVVSTITGYGGEFCTFFGANGADTNVYAEDTASVIPPQAQASVVCQSD